MILNETIKFYELISTGTNLIIDDLTLQNNEIFKFLKISFYTQKD